MLLKIDRQGGITLLYSEALDLAALGPVSIRRASHVEPDEQGRWWAEIIGGPVLGPFARRSLALSAEVDFIETHVL